MPVPKHLLTPGPCPPPSLFTLTGRALKTSSLVLQGVNLYFRDLPWWQAGQGTPGGPAQFWAENRGPDTWALPPGTPVPPGRTEGTEALFLEEKKT